MPEKSLYHDLKRRTKEADEWWHVLQGITRVAIWEDYGARGCTDMRSINNHCDIAPQSPLSYDMVWIAGLGENAFCLKYGRFSE